MKTRRFLAWTLSVALAGVFGPGFAYGQATTTTTTTGGGTTTGATVTSTPVTGTGAGGVAGTGGTGAQTATAQGLTPVAFSTIEIVKLATNSGNGSATATPSNTNSFVNWYGNPMSLGLPSKYVNSGAVTPSATFGTPLYAATTSTAAGKGATGAKAATGATTGFNTVGKPRFPVYTTYLGDDIPRVVHTPTNLHATVRAMVERSSYLKSQGTIQVNVNGSTVVLTGQVASASERRKVEGLIRTTAGVRDVQNGLQIVNR